MRDLASQLDMSEDQAGSAMAQVLPEVINRLTPEGQMPGNSNDEIAQGLSMLPNSELLKIAGAVSVGQDCIDHVMGVVIEI